MSKSGSPSITQFFKAQRKRPRTEKEDGGGGVSASKRLLLEEGIVSKLVSVGEKVEIQKKKVVVEEKKKRRVGVKKKGEVGKKGVEPVETSVPVEVKKSEVAEKEKEVEVKLSEVVRKKKDGEEKPEKLVEERKMEGEVKKSEVVLKMAVETRTAGVADKKSVAAKRKAAAAVARKLLELQEAKTAKLSEQPAPVEPVKIAPAYQRFHNLAQKTATEKGVSADEADLPLPYHFKVLQELFIGVETVVGMMKARKEIITFPKVKAAVQELFKKVSLREKHLAQMATVLPGCYKFGLEKVGKETHLKIEVEDLPPSVVCARRKAFHANLITICLEHHKKFLLGLVPPMVLPEDKKITRWHPNFKLDQLPDIVAEENALPVKPAPEKASTARDVIAKAQNIIENGNSRMRLAMQNMLNNAEDKEGQTPQKVMLKPKSQATIKSLKGVSSSLLEKIRNREKEKMLNELTRSPAESKKLLMMKRLPEFVKIIRNMIVAEKKVALPMSVVLERVSHSVQNMSAGETDAHIRLLVTLLPLWIKIVRLSHSDVEYLRIDKAVDINNLLQEINDIIKKNSS